MTAERETYFKKVLVGSVILLWLTPLFQTLFSFVELRKLNGAVSYSPDDSLSYETWFKGTYSGNKEKYINEQFGFRNFFVRFRNQIYFSLLKVPTANGVIIGKDNFLYEEKYIASYTGVDFIGVSAVRKNIEKIKFVSDTLKKLHIDLVLILAPGKASYYPEYIPDSYFINSDTINTNYKWVAKMAQETGLNYIDYNALFMKKKGSTKYPLFPKTGIHWSFYGAYYACDSLIKYIENIKQKQLPHFKYDKIKWDSNLREADEDIALGLNTLFDIPHFKMAYPEIEYYDTINKYRPRTLTISDSFWGNIFWEKLPLHLFRKPEYWYFYNQTYDYGPGAVNPLAFDLKEKIESNDVIIILATEAHIGDMGWGFIEDAYNLYSKGEESLKDHKRTVSILRSKRGMKADPKWLFNMEVEAKNLNISLDSNMTRTAIWVIENDPAYKIVEEKKFNNEIIVSIENVIKANVDFMKLLLKKADEKNTPIGLIISEKATHIYETRGKVFLRAINKKYMCTNAANTNFILADKDAASLWEEFSLIKLTEDECMILSFDDHFLSVEYDKQNEITARRTEVGKWGVFTVVPLENNFIALRAANGKFLSIDERSFQLFARANNIGNQEKFEVIYK